MPLDDLLGYIGAAGVLVTMSMRTMIPLRALAIAVNVVMLTYGLEKHSMPTIVLQAILLPINAYRLREMVRLTRQVRMAATGGMSLDWLRPFMHRRRYRAGDVVFRRGDPADAMYYVLGGRFVLPELDEVVRPDTVVGEVGLITPDLSRTRTLQCEADGELLVIGYDEVRQLYFQNPEFGFWLLRLAGGRLIANMQRAEAGLSAAPARP
jgi:CRP/FNR family transcriptional regulator, cyclic AMP receptor protein